MIKYLGLLYFAWSYQANAWWSFEHKLIAHIAENTLIEETKKAIAPLLSFKINKYEEKFQSLSPSSFVESSNWLDLVRSPSNPKLFACHFANFPIEKSQLEKATPQDIHSYLTNQLATLPKREMNIVNCTEWALNELVLYFSGITTAENGAVALRFLVHLVGDMHQPLHVATLKLEDSTLDQGGNKIFIKDSNGKSISLHQAFDSALGLLPNEDISTQSHVKMTPLVEEWHKKLQRHYKNTSISMDALDHWVEESFMIAFFKVYKKLISFPRSPGQAFEFILPISQFQKDLGDEITLQIWKAGYRLGWLLNTLMTQKKNHPFVKNRWPDL